MLFSCTKYGMDIVDECISSGALNEEDIHRLGIVELCDYARA